MFEEFKRKYDLVAKDVRRQKEEIDRLKKELKARPKEKEILKKFRASPAYYTELNDKAVEKIQICWNVASRYLTEVPGGPIDGFLESYIQEENQLLEENKAAEGESSGPKIFPLPEMTQFLPLTWITMRCLLLLLHPTTSRLLYLCFVKLDKILIL